MLISQISPDVNNNTSKGISSLKKNNIYFTSASHLAEDTINVTRDSKLFKPLEDSVGKPVKNLYDKFTDQIARGIGKLLSIKGVREGFEKLGKSEHMRKHGLAHLIVLGSTLLSGFYIKKTLDNKKLDKDKKVTLAINQFATWAISATAAYTIDGKLHDAVDKIKEKFMSVNNIDPKSKTAKAYGGGFSAARTIIVIGVVYRFIAPVFVTPIANAIGNHILAKKENKAESVK